MAKSKGISNHRKNEHEKALMRLIKEAAHYKREREVFSDFIEMSAITISNTVDLTHRYRRESRYLDIIRSYEPRHQRIFPEMFGTLVLALEEKTLTRGPEDVLGPIFHELNMSSFANGQYFTPQEVADMVAMLTFGSSDEEIEKHGFISMDEPTCGSGVMVTSMCKAMMQNDFNYNHQLLVIANDISSLCVHMTYLQLSLYGVPAVVIHGNTLTLEQWSCWHTPFYIIHGWGAKHAAMKKST